MISQDKENLTSLLVLSSELIVVLDGEVFLTQKLRIFNLISDSGLRFRLLRLSLEIFEISVSQRKDVPIDLNHIEREINIRQVKVDELQLWFLLDLLLILVGVWVLKIRHFFIKVSIIRFSLLKIRKLFCFVDLHI